MNNVRTELTLGTVVGTGGFSTVTEIKFVDLDELYDDDDENDDHHGNNNNDHHNNVRHPEDPIGTSMRRRQRRRQFADSVRQGNTKYVLKMLRTDLPVDEHTKGIADLAIEASFLRVLSHPHIISLQAVSHSDPYGPRFFIVLERLRTTLDRKFNEWRRIVNESAGYWIPCYGYCCPKVTVLHATWIERFTVAHSIASALEYLHQRCIIYRDLKPDNIGFDGTGRVQMFDFGLAKRLDDVAKTDDDENYRLTGNTGSLRYMSPEVARNLPYNLSADSYSFGILFWQICALQTPFAGFTTASHFKLVVQQNQRPHPDKTWPWSWTECMMRSWSLQPKERPSMTEIVRALEEIILDVEAMAEDGIVPCRASEIRAKKKRKKINRENQMLDLDTRKNIINNNISMAMVEDSEIV
jgi:serine/threonine protein kinase